MQAPELSAEQEALFRLIEDTRDHVFVTGRAGTGKSTLLQHLAWNTSKQIAVCASTGVAALNVEGQTIHSLFRLPIGLIADGDIDLQAESRQFAFVCSICRALCMELHFFRFENRYARAYHRSLASREVAYPSIG